MTFNNSTGFTQIETDDGVAFINSEKPNFKFIGQNNIQTSHSDNQVILKKEDIETTGVQGILNIGMSRENPGTIAERRRIIHSSDGTNLNISNGFVRLPLNGNSSGLNKVYTINQNYRILGTHLNDNLLGKRQGDNWFLNMPLYIYAVSNQQNNQVWFAVSRVPWRRKSTNSNISGSAIAKNGNEQTSFVYMQKFDGENWVNPILGDFSETSCKAIGTFLVQSTQDNWNIQALDLQTKIGHLAESRTYVFPTGLYGAPTNQHFQIASSTGTGSGGVSWGSSNHDYSLSSKGFFWGRPAFIASTNGTSTAGTVVTLPFDIRDFTFFYGFGQHFTHLQAPPPVETLTLRTFLPAKNQATIFFVNSTASGAKLSNAWTTEGAHRCNFHIWGQVEI
jgi:hypothetical protein